MRFTYPVQFEEVKEGPPQDYCILVRFPDLPEAITYGTDKEDALESAKDCLEVALAMRIKYGKVIPTPSKLENCKTISVQRKNVMYHIEV